MSGIRSALVILFGLFAAPAFASDHVKFTEWHADIFDKAASEQRFVILDLEAVWCHWCHVMEKTTYSDPKINDLIGKKYLPVRADQDANPDLASRYGDWGWPATIIFDSQGNEIVKLRGYVEPERMASILQAVIDDPSPGPSIGEAFSGAPATDTFLSKDKREALLKTYDESYEDELGGWGENQKFIDSDSFDYAMSRAEAGDSVAAKRLRQTLDAAIALIDPVWGGVYQYSEGGSWQKPHFEKIMSFQAQYLRQYSQAYARWKDPKYLKAANDIARYVTSTLSSPDGAFYVSQDADLSRDVDGHAFYALDDAGRKKLGAPRVDKNAYARETGWAISGLAAYYGVTNDAATRAQMERAAKWVAVNRSLPDGGFRHGDKDRGGPYLGDNIAVAEAFLDLYAVTGDRVWLTQAAKTGDFIASTFRDNAGGFFTSKTGEAKVGVFAKPAKLMDDQIATTRLFNLLDRYFGEAKYHDHAAHAMKYLAALTADMPRPLPGVLLAEEELATEPTHITIVGAKADAQAKALHAVARAFPARYKRLEWLDVREGKLPNPDVEYPDLGKAAAFACSNRICSYPSFTEAELKDTVAQMAKLKPARQAAR